jgi:hypothetical protein
MIKYFYLVYMFFSCKFREDFFELFRRGPRRQGVTETRDRTITYIEKKN